MSSTALGLNSAVSFGDIVVAAHVGLVVVASRCTAHGILSSRRVSSHYLISRATNLDVSAGEGKFVLDR